MVDCKKEKTMGKYYKRPYSENFDTEEEYLDWLNAYEKAEEERADFRRENEVDFNDFDENE